MKTTITISNKLGNELNKLKYHYGFKTIEEVIRHYIKEVDQNDTQNKNALEKMDTEKVS
tara:strand:+ start:585 stop:761 length:177 start_codon:yes stop_codon:yes gene_type:complete